MNNEHEHYWNYDHAIYDVIIGKCLVRRWCSICGLVQHSHTGIWHNSSIGPEEMFDTYPEGYDMELIEEPTP